jgi:hypothetical protein
MTSIPLAVIVHDKGDPIEAAFAGARDRLLARGDLRVAGVVPRLGAPHGNGRPSMWLDDILTGEEIPISQNLGAGSDACCLDPNGIASLTMRLAAAIETAPDVLLCGRFAKEELAGRGIRVPLAEAIDAGIATVVAVDRNHLEGWIAFVGDDWTPIAPDPEAIVAWVATLRPAHANP